MCQPTLNAAQYPNIAGVQYIFQSLLGASLHQLDEIWEENITISITEPLNIVLNHPCIVMNYKTFHWSLIVLILTNACRQFL